MFRLAIILIVFGLYTEHAIGGSFVIYNNLKRGNLMKIHCKSGDNSMGYHVRRPGRFYLVKFSDHILDKTLYWCTLWQGPDFKHKQVIVAYDGQMLPHKDNWVRWAAKESGIYQSVDGAEPFRFKYNWDDKL
ncbi:unnamed protein product [Microthlaspi erraticum]|uniref:S-protein homolog n=1 Tax=Microthlaspi erraticum TaxID=1685480 RepID=A0A6D2L2W7_9BRAS|nr:unnamed protein product [Microthlaspi erraticum]